eukprot:Sspe_Gene.107877::Locus_86695_Transcript_1_1_Confidence_1.000_Length_404::g.107877::m.107877
MNFLDLNLTVVCGTCLATKYTRIFSPASYAGLLVAVEAHRPRTKAELAETRRNDTALSPQPHDIWMGSAVAKGIPQKPQEVRVTWCDEGEVYSVTTQDHWMAFANTSASGGRLKLKVEYVVTTTKGMQQRARLK